MRRPTPSQEPFATRRKRTNLDGTHCSDFQNDFAPALRQWPAAGVHACLAASRSAGPGPGPGGYAHAAPRASYAAHALRPASQSRRCEGRLIMSAILHPKLFGHTDEHFGADRSVYRRFLTDGKASAGRCGCGSESEWQPALAPRTGWNRPGRQRAGGSARRGVPGPGGDRGRLSAAAIGARRTQSCLRSEASSALVVGPHVG